MKKLCFIVVNYENCNNTVELLHSLINQSNLDCEYSIELLVVDNSVSDKEKRMVNSAMAAYKIVGVLRPNNNIGYFGGINYGLERIDCSKYDYVIIGNNDLTFSSDFSVELIKKRYEEDILVVAPNIITKDGRHQNPHVISRVSTIRKLVYDIYFYNYYFSRILLGASTFMKWIVGERKKPADHSQYIHMGIGACYILTPSFFKHFKKLDDALFLYGEEAVLAGQVMSVSCKTYYDSSLVVTHAESATLSKFPSRFTYSHMKKSYPIYRKYL